MTCKQPENHKPFCAYCGYWASEAQPTLCSCPTEVHFSDCRVLEQWNERDQLRAQNEVLRDALGLAIAFHSADTQKFVALYGHGMTTRELCDRLRAALTPEGQSA